MLSALLTAQAAPSVTGFTPVLGKPGTQVVISGSGFSTATQVQFDSTVADFSAGSDNQIIATVPPDATTGPIRVTNPTGTGNSGASFFVAPRISELAPVRGATNTTLVINGFNFTNTTSVLFNNRTSLFTVTQPTQIRATVPYGATNGPVTVMTPAGTAVSSNAFAVIGPEPIIDNISPGAGAPGTSVTIYGVNFATGATVRFNTVSDSSAAVVAAAQINAHVPAAATTGKITVTTSAGTATSATNFIVTQAPIVTNFFPKIGVPGTLVTIEGINFTGVTGVGFNGKPVASIVGTPGPNQIVVTVPPAATNSGPITVTNGFGFGASAEDFIITRAPIIDSFLPVSGGPSTQVRIYGVNLSNGPTVLRIGGALASFVVVGQNGSQIVANLPSGATTGPISMTNAYGSFTTSSNFSVTGSAPAVTGFSPDRGPRGAAVLIQGKSFFGPVTVKFNGVVDPTTTTAAALDQIRATVPADATTGPITVTTTNGTSTNLNTFYVPPRLASFSPTNGVTGGSVTVLGANFTGTTAVSFNTASADFALNSSTKLTLVVPADATTGPLTITAPGGVIISANSFRVLPNITSFSPTLGPAGTEVGILGTSFFNVTNVSFNGIKAASFTAVSSTEIRATVPPSATTGPIRVSTPDGTAVSAANFLVTARSDLALAMSASTTLAKPGEPLTYRLVVTNKGPSIVSGVTLTNRLPNGVNFLSVSSTNGSCTQTNGVVTCNIGVMTNNTGFTMSIAVVPPVEAVLNNTATISSAESDLNPGNNTASVITPVILDSSRTLQVRLVPGGRNMVISWQFSVIPFTLQFRDSLSVTNPWQPVTNVPVVINARNTVTNDASGPGRFFRLFSP